MAERKAGASRETAERDPLRVEGARERLLEAAYGLFSRHGIHSVGIDRIIAEADVAKATLYHHFPSKEALVIAFLDLREARWTHGWLCAEVERRAAVPQERALASAVYQAAVHHLAVIRELLVGYAEDAGASNPEEVGHQLQVLLMGSIVAAGGGDTQAALRARPLAAALLAGDGRKRRGT
jgi:AcrR family transcriptional regulator